MAEGQDRQLIDSVLRALSTASRSLRLYPPASPIPRQSIEGVQAALSAVFDAGVDPFEVCVGRESFESDGEPAAVGIPGGQELAAELRAHGVSVMRFANGVTADELLSMLILVSQPADQIRQSGGFGACLEEDAVHNVAVTEVQLTIIDAQTPEENVTGGFGTGAGFGIGGADANEIAGDPAKLGEWLSEAASGDRSGLETGLISLVEAVGPQGGGTLASSLSSAFGAQSTETRDALLGLAMNAGPFRNLMGEMFRHQSATDIASSVLEGAYGRNMLSLSNAITALPLDQLDDAVQAQIRSMLPGMGHTEAEAVFLEHMIEVRRSSRPEPSLAASDQTYLAVAQASAIKPDDLDRARKAVEASGAAIDAAGVRTMFTLLDQQSDPEQLRIGAENLVRMVTRLLISAQLPLAEYVVCELFARGDRVFASQLLPRAATPQALGALIDATLANPETLEMTRALMSAFGPSADAAFVAEAISRKADGLRLAENLLGKRMMEHLHAAVLNAQWFQLGPVVTRLAIEGGSRDAATIEALVRRPDPQARKEIVLALAAANTPLALRLLAELVNDANPEVAVAAARSLAKSGAPESGPPIAARLAQLDIDNSDFDLARELIQALARTPGATADEALGKLAARRALIKRGRFTDVQAAVTAALQMRAREVVGR